MSTSLWFGRVLEECGFLWYEEPMREFELGSYRKLCDALDIPVLAAETSDGCHWNMATWIQMGALDMTRTTRTSRAAFTGSMKIAHLSDSHGMRCQVHGMGLRQRPALRRHPQQRLLRAARDQRPSRSTISADLGPLAIEGGYPHRLRASPGLGRGLRLGAGRAHGPRDGLSR